MKYERENEARFQWTLRLIRTTGRRYAIAPVDRRDFQRFRIRSAAGDFFESDEISIECEISVDWSRVCAEVNRKGDEDGN